MHFLKLIPFLLLIIACSTTEYKSDKTGRLVNIQNSNSHPYVVMISIDGLRHDYIDMYQPKFLSRIRNEGIFAQSLISIFPSKTFPNHYSLATGLYAQNHGIVGNRFFDPDRNKSYRLGDNTTTQDGSWYNGNPLWLSVRQQGLLSASYFWVGSDANINGHYPNYYYDYKHSTPNNKRTKQVIEWLKMDEKYRPHLLSLYFSDVDSAGHRFGPKSNQVKEALLSIDSEIEQMVEKINALNLDVNFVLVSDHGMIKIDGEKTIFLKKYYDEDIKFEGRGPLTYATVKDKSKIKILLKRFNKVKYLTAYTPQQLPERYHLSKSNRIGDIIIVASAGAYIYPNKSEGKPAKGATHGYDPISVKQMGGTFISWGSHVKRSGMIGSFENIHVYPFVMKLLGLKVQKEIDGRSEVLRNYYLKKKSP